MSKSDVLVNSQRNADTVTQAQADAHMESLSDSSRC